MEKRTVGNFIATLRRANGMTQQELADTLHVSNKVISRWEREETLPDLSLIPIIAEIFGVSCDELLKGERIINNQNTEKPSLKIEKNIERIINRSIVRFKNNFFIAMTSSILGIILMIFISYGLFGNFYPLIGGAVLLLCVVISLVIAFITNNKMNIDVMNNELLDSLDLAKQTAIRKTKSIFITNILLINAIAIILSIPLIFLRNNYIYGAVLTYESYFAYCGIVVAIIPVAFYIINHFCRKFFLREQMQFPTKGKLIVSRIMLTVAFMASIITFFCFFGDFWLVPFIVVFLIAYDFIYVRLRRAVFRY